MSKTQHWNPQTAEEPSDSQTDAPALKVGASESGPQLDVPGPPDVLESIMVIDDDEDLLELWEVGFAHMGVEAVLHTSAESAMMDAELWEVDLIVTDLDLPRTTGPDLIARVRAARPEVAILCVTGSRKRELITAAYAAGAYDCLLKPCSASQIVSRGIKGSATQSATGRMGSRIDGTPYLVDGVIGEGGAGMVYAGIHLDLGRRVAIKVSKLGVSPAHTKQVLAEARVLESLRSRHVPDVLDFRELDDGRALYVMEFVKGETVHARLRRRGPLSLNDALDLMQQALDGVAVAHGQGIAHLDLKPENLILSQDQAGNLLVKILDFGLAAVAGAGVMGFTEGWASPEQTERKKCDARSDVFNLGLLLEFLLTGQPPNLKRDFHPALLPAELEGFQMQAVAWWIDKCRRADPDSRFEDAAAAKQGLAQAFTYFKEGGE